MGPQNNGEIKPVYLWSGVTSPCLRGRQQTGVIGASTGRLVTTSNNGSFLSLLETLLKITKAGVIAFELGYLGLSGVSRPRGATQAGRTLQTTRARGRLQPSQLRLKT